MDFQALVNPPKSWTSSFLHLLVKEDAKKSWVFLVLTVENGSRPRRSRMSPK